MVEPCIFDIARSPPTIRALECTLRWVLYFWREKGCCTKRFSFVNWNCGHPGTRQGTVCWWPALDCLRDTTSTIWRSWSWWSFFTIHDHIFLQITPPLPYWGHNKEENQKSKPNDRSTGARQGNWGASSESDFSNSSIFGWFICIVLRPKTKY